MVIGIDPGPVVSASAVLEPELTAWGTARNEDIAAHAAEGKNVPSWIIAIESFQSYGKPIGKSSLDTVYWTGRFAQQALTAGARVLLIPRKRIVTVLCGSARAGDPQVRAALLKLYPGAKCTGHEWSALAVAHVASRLNAAGIKEFEVT